MTIANGVSLASSVTSATTLTLTGTSTATNMLSGVIANGGGAGGSLALAINGGTWSFGALNTFTGGLTINSGGTMISTTGGGATSVGTGSVTINSGGTLIAGGQDSLPYTGTITINGGGTLTDLGTSNYRTTLGNIVFNGGGTLTSVAGNNGDGSGNFSLLGTTVVVQNPGSSTAVISAKSIGLQHGNGAGLEGFQVARGTATYDLVVSSILQNFNGSGIDKTGLGVMELTGANTFTGGVQVDAGTLVAGSAAALGAGGPVVLNNVNTGVATAVTLDLYTGGATTIGSLSGTLSTASSGTNTAVLNNPVGLTINQTAAGAFAGSITDSGSLTLSAASTAALTLTGANSYGGTTTIAGGTLILSGAGTLGSGAVTLSGGTLALNTAGALGSAPSLTISGGRARQYKRLGRVAFELRDGNVDR